MEEQTTNRLDTLQLYLSHNIRKGGNEEVGLACRTLSLVVITLGMESESFGRAFMPLLSTFIKNNSKPVSSRKACLQALGTVHFIISSGSPAESIDAMALFEQIFLDTKINPTLSAEAVELWSLLASTLSALHLGTDIYQKYLPLFTKMLDHKDFELRAASGEAIALLYSASLEAEEVEEETKETKKTKEKKKQNSKYQPDIAALTEQLKALAKEGSKHQARKDKIKQRSLFRDIVHTVEDGTAPIEKITIGKKKYEFVGWGKVKQLSRIREVLGTGLPLHFAQNDLLTEIFEVSQEITEPGKRDKKLDRVQRQEKEKSSFLEIEKQRKKKNAFLDDILHND